MRHAGHGFVFVLLLLVGCSAWLYLSHLLLLHSFLAVTNQTTLEVLKVR
jgi:amino acid permease